eukprot:6851173-Prymnesium_polylepis.1
MPRRPGAYVRRNYSDTPPLPRNAFYLAQKYTYTRPRTTCFIRCGVARLGILGGGGAHTAAAAPPPGSAVTGVASGRPEDHHA